jgi:hypothetical protein
VEAENPPHASQAGTGGVVKLGVKSALGQFEAAVLVKKVVKSAP